MSLHPPVVQFIKSYRYTVANGDSVDSIAKKFGMPIARWPELVGANRHKPLAQYRGINHLCFQNIEPGERLSIPANWADTRLSVLGVPQNPGAPGTAIILDYTDLIKAFTETLVKFWHKFISPMFSGIPSILPGLSLPGLPGIPSLPGNIPVNINDLSKVIFTWWPYIANQLPNPSSWPTAAIPSSIEHVVNNNILTPQNWSNLFNTAEAFLRSMGYGGNQPNQIPTPIVTSIPWGDIPWNDVGNVIGNISNGLATLMGQKTQYMHSGYVGQPSFAPQLPNFFDPTQWNPGGKMHKIAQSPVMAGGNWNEFLTTILQDPRLLSCSQQSSNPSRLELLKNCPNCWQTPKQFIDLYCNQNQNPCDGCETVPIPVETLPTVPSTETTREDKKDNTFTYAAIGVGVLLLGGLLVSMKADEK